VRAIGETGEAFILIPAKPSMHRLTRDVDAARHLNDWDAVADHREHCLIPLFHDTQLHQHARECVADQAEPASRVG
jgi:hypothetical protein